MTALPPALDKLATLLSRLPGVGRRTASRYAFFILSEPDGYAESLADSLAELAAGVFLCSECHHLAEARDEMRLCAVCRDTGRDRSTVCVVHRVQELLAIERTGAYRGLYHVLHGVLSPLKGIGPLDLELENLKPRLATLEAQEVILALSSDVEGEATALYLADLLGGSGVTVSRLATGVPMGGDLEYVDQTTLSRALEGRTTVKHG